MAEREKGVKGNIPTSVKIGWKDYSIEHWHPDEANEARRYGETRSVTHIIKIDTSKKPARVAETLLHEIIHCVFEIWNIEDEDKEERTVSALATGLATVWRDNPSVFEFIDMNLLAKPVE